MFLFFSEGRKHPVEGVFVQNMNLCLGRVVLGDVCPKWFMTFS